MNEKQVIRYLLGILAQSTLKIEGAGLAQVVAVLREAERIAGEPDETPDDPDEGVPVGDGDSD